MEKSKIIEAYYHGLLSKDECTKILGIDPTILINSNVDALVNVIRKERYIQ